MDAQQKELLRLALLRVMDANKTGRGLGPVALKSLIGTYAATASVEEIAIELSYLADKEMVASVDKRISPELTAWRITATGRDFIAQN
jgi:hypothetical protein